MRRRGTIRGPRVAKAGFDQALRNIKLLSDGGVMIAMGTDSGTGTGRWQGYFEHVEMELMVKAGMTPMQTLVAATGNAAKVMKIDNELGTLQPGKRADLVVLNADPLSGHQEHTGDRVRVDRRPADCRLTRWFNVPLSLRREPQLPLWLNFY